MLTGKTVVVTGVGTGLGREVVRCAVRDGANLVLGARTEATLEAVAKEFDPEGERIAHRATEIRQQTDCDALAALAVDRFGACDALVQVAALATTFGGLSDARDEDWRDTLETNVLGSVHMVKAVAEPMKRQGGGSVVLIGAQASFLPQVSQIAYAASKGALHSAMFFMAKELGSHRIRVNTVVPSWMWGPPVQGYLAGQAQETGRSEEELIAEITKNFCLPEITPDDDVAEAAIFLCSDRARMITGQSIFVSAGEYLT